MVCRWKCTEIWSVFTSECVRAGWYVMRTATVKKSIVCDYNRWTPTTIEITKCRQWKQFGPGRSCSQPRTETAIPPRYRPKYRTLSCSRVESTCGSGQKNPVWKKTFAKHLNNCGRQPRVRHEDLMVLCSQTKFDTRAEIVLTLGQRDRFCNVKGEGCTFASR